MANYKAQAIKLPDGNTYEIIPPVASETECGGVIASPKTDSDTVEVKIGNDGKLYVPSQSIDIDELKSYVDEAILGGEW